MNLSWHGFLQIGFGTVSCSCLKSQHVARNSVKTKYVKFNLGHLLVMPFRKNIEIGLHVANVKNHIA